jgi:RNA polymerase sigma-70 factor (ECF subfamily)
METCSGRELASRAVSWSEALSFAANNSEGLARRSDAELLQASGADSAVAFAELVGRFRPRLLSFAGQSFGDRAVADDLVQETFAAVFAARESYDPRFAVSTWIWTILLNLCRKQRRGDRRRSEVHTAWAADQSASRGDESALDELVRRDEQRRLREQLAELPAAQADALRLRFFAELSFEEIAAAMDSSVSGAKVRVRKGLAALSARLLRDDSAPIVRSAEDDAT